VNVASSARDNILASVIRIFDADQSGKLVNIGFGVCLATTPSAIAKKD
jgi:hypothetical protein